MEISCLARAERLWPPALALAVVVVCARERRPAPPGLWRRLWPLALALGLVCAASAPSAASGENWPRFRGPTGMGATSERGLPLTWGGPASENVRWKVPLPFADGEPDFNQSSPIVWADRVFLTVCAWPRGRDHHEYPDQIAACYRARDGELLWKTAVPPGPLKLSDLRGGYCAPTPATDGERVYVLFGSGALAALDFEGKPVWRQDLADSQDFDVAISSSPIVYRDTVLLLADKGRQKSTLLAFDARQGAVRWQAPRPKAGFSHGTPVIVDINGRPEMLVAASYALEGIDPDNGRIRWWSETPGDVCSPVYAGGAVYLDSGRGGPAILAAPGGEGDVTATNVKWRISHIPEGLSSPCVAGELLYRLHAPGVLKCLRMADGTVAFATRLDGVSTSASPLVTSEGILYFASAGKTFVVRAGPKFDLIASNELGEPHPSSAAVSDGRIFLKGREHLFCIGAKP